jgi:hypothetical protein
MNSKQLNAIEERITRKFPDLAGIRPKVSHQKSAGKANFLLTFNGSGEGPGGNIIKKTVRVVANQNGKILKVSTSR